MMECTNPGLFSAGPDWLDPGELRRHEALWQFAQGRAEGEGGALRRHVDECRACARLVQKFRRLDGAARAGADVFAVCPSAKDLSDYAGYELPVDVRRKVDAHLEACAFCREDLAWLDRTAESKVVAMNRRRWLMYGAVAAAIALLALIPLLRRSSPYADLAQIPAMDRTDLMATLHEPQNFRPVLEASLDAYEAGDYRVAEAKASTILEALPADPSALFVAAMCEYRQGHSADAEKLMDESEGSQPMTEFRCWAALQLALATGSRVRIDRECKHLENAPGYAPQVRRIQQIVR
jgi:anti-sigma factor RsiW